MAEHLVERLRLSETAREAIEHDAPCRIRLAQPLPDEIAHRPVVHQAARIQVLLDALAEGGPGHDRGAQDVTGGDRGEMVPLAHPRRLRAGFDLAVELMWAAFAVSLIVLGWQVARVAAMQESPGLEVPMSWPYFSMVAGGAYLLLLAVRRMADWGARVRGQAAP